MNTAEVSSELLKMFFDLVEKECKHEIDAENKQGDRLKKVEDLRKAKQQRLEDLKRELMLNQEIFLTAEPDQLQDLSWKRVEMEREQTQIVELLGDLEKHTLPVIDVDRVKTQKAFGANIGAIVNRLKKLHEEEILSLIYELVEPRIVGWGTFVNDILAKYRVPLSESGYVQNVKRDRKIEFYSKPILDAVEDSSNDRKLVEKAANFRGGASEKKDQK